MRADWEREALAAVEEATKERIVGHDQMILIVANTLEPLIRADERAKHPGIPAVTRATMDVAMPLIRADLSAKVQALPLYAAALDNALWCYSRADVLALFASNSTPSSAKTGSSE